jgi:NTE family protein
MFGAYQAGVWKVLSGVLHPDVVVGASAGAVNAWAIAGGCDPEDLMGVSLDPEMASMFHRVRWWPPWRGLFDARPMEEAIRRTLAKYQPRIEIGITGVELPGLRRRLFRGEEIGFLQLAASCAVPGGFPPRRIDGKLYTDGGVLGALPLWAAAEMGAKRAVAVNVLEIPPSRTLRCAVRVAQALGPRAPSAADVECVTISPSRRLGSVRDALSWKRERVESWIELGMEDAVRTGVRDWGLGVGG